MSPRPSVFGWRHAAGLSFLVVLTVAAIDQLTTPLWGDPEIVLELGGTVEDLRRRSSADFSPGIRGHSWAGIPGVDARLRFIDLTYGFETPLARFFVVMFDDRTITSIRMSPQVEPLLIDDVLKVVLDLQAQWCAKGWVPMGIRRNPTIVDTPEWRSYLSKGIQAGQSFWQAADKYQVALFLARFKDIRNPTEERYLITLSIGKPWISFEDIEGLHDEPHHFPAPQPKTQGGTPCQPQPS